MNKARLIALGGITAALIAICLYAASIVPGGKLGFYFIAAFLPVLMLLEGYRAGALLSAGAAAALLLLLLPNKMTVLPYVCFLGWYAALRDCLIGKRLLTARAILLVAFNAGVALWWVLSVNLLGFDPAMMFGRVLPAWLWVGIALAAQAIFLLADFFFGLCVDAYRTRIHQRIFRK